VEVTDRGKGFDPELVPPPRRSGIGGWGLYLVDRLADRWGVDGDRATRVWFEIDNASS
jgi:anti-sigma regulatory factor (Ser/Thr protein kinase)